MNGVEKSDEYRMVKDFPEKQDPTVLLAGDGVGGNKRQTYNETTKT